MTAKPPARFVVCLRNDGYPESLEPRKLYRVPTDATPARVNFLRVVDESGEDRLYPKGFFTAVRLTPPARKALAKV